MGSVNKVILVGNLGRDAELRYTPGGAAVATLNMATTEVWTDKARPAAGKTEWHRVVLWGKVAESLTEYLTKGKQVYVEGRLETRQWDDKDGNKRYTTEIQGRQDRAARRRWRRRSARRRRLARGGGGEESMGGGQPLARRRRPGHAAHRRRHPVLTLELRFLRQISDSISRSLQSELLNLHLIISCLPVRTDLRDGPRRAARGSRLRRCRCLRSRSCGAPSSA